MHGEGYVTLDCTVDDSYVVVNRNDLGGSHLVADLPQDEEFGTLAVPFTRNAVQAWHAVKKGEHVNLDFVGCIGALKVSDFLVDVQTTAKAAAKANRCLFPDIELPVRANPTDEEALRSLPEHVILAVLQSWQTREPEGGEPKTADILRCMLEALSSRFHPLVVASCVSNSSLNIDRPLDEEHVAAIVAAVPALAHKLNETEIQYWMLLAKMCSRVFKEQKPQFCLSIWPVASDMGEWIPPEDIFITCGEPDGIVWDSSSSIPLLD